MDINGYKILIVDDEVALCDNLAALFELEGFTTYRAYSGNEAFEIYNNSGIQFDLILTDIKMPDGDGVELVKKVRALNKKIPFIYVMSGFSEHSESELIGYGADLFLPKPFEFDEIQRIAKTLESGEICILKSQD